ncbi:restriction endonuclease [Jiangella endophytica]|uniref:restriction endonuclease n=1 Tax=Jiangella endophytica TaxID=1623398 RepID=UPI0018E5468D|nr:restriction endonuclease [Jiangella endophytica]
MTRRSNHPTDEPSHRITRRLPGSAVGQPAGHDGDDARAAERAERAERAAERTEHVRRHQADAADMTSAIAARVAELESILVDGLAAGGPVHLGQLRHGYRPWPFVPDRALVTAAEAPAWDDYAPPPMGRAARLLTGGRRRAVAQARARYDRAVRAHREHEALRRAALAEAERRHAVAEASRREQIDRHNAQVDQVELGVEAGDARAVGDYYQLLIEAAALPDGLPVAVDVAYRPDERRLLVVRDLPTVEIVPVVREYQYVRSLDQVAPRLRSAKDIRRLYSGLVAQLVLRTLQAAFVAQPPGLVDEVAVNAHVSARNRATGRSERPCLVSVTATREQFGDLVLTRLDPRECLRHLNAVVSPHPWDLEAVPPIFDPDLSRYRLVEPQDAAAVLDGRPVVLRLRPVEFEHLVRQLFEAMGMRAWATRASGDDGVDAVAVNTDPIMGGVCVVQAKRYRKVVPPDAVRALAGAMEDKRAGRGVLVTTSWFGRATHEFAARHGRIQLIDGGQLEHLLAEHLGLRVVIGPLDRPIPRQSGPAPDAANSPPL